MGNQLQSDQQMKQKILVNSSHFPDKSLELIMQLCENAACDFKVRKKRMSKLGDFRYPFKGRNPVITVNNDLNPFHFLITFLHEFAHYAVYTKYGKKVTAHGPEWKSEFSNLVLPFYEIGIFPDELSPHIERLIKKPKASSFGDIELLRAFRHFDNNSEPIVTLDELDEEGLFKLTNGRVFRKIQKRRSRVLCYELASRKKYLIHRMAEVIPLESNA